MIIFNNEEMKSKYTKTENRVITINSLYSLEEFVKKIWDGEEIDTDKVSITSYRYADDILFQSETDVPSNLSNTNIYDYRYPNRPEMTEAYTHVPQDRPLEFNAFEQFTFGRRQSIPFQAEDIALDKENQNIQEFEGNTDRTKVLTRQDLLKELKMVMGALPSLLEDEFTLEEFYQYVKDGNALIHPAYPIYQYNPCPTIEDISAYQSLSTYEKRLINQRLIHPLKALRYLTALKESLFTNYIINIQDYNNLFKDNPRDPQKFVEKYSSEFLSRTSSSEHIMEMTKNEFQSIWHFTPQVAQLYIEGCMARDNIQPINVTQEHIHTWVSEFTLHKQRNSASISKVLQARSAAVLAFAVQENLTRFPVQFIEALNVYITLQNIATLKEKGFFEWFSAQQNIRIADFVEIIELLRNVESFDVHQSAQDIIKMANNYAGFLECKKYENTETPRMMVNGKPLVFADNEIAIKGRHTVAKQGNYTMRMLAADDYDNFMVGKYTYCCQQYGDAGGSCVAKYVSDPFAACVVIEDKDKISAQGFVWVDVETDTLVFDNIEFEASGMYEDDKDNLLSVRYRDLISKWCEAMPYKNIHIGTGYNASMRGWGHPVDYAAKLPTTVGNDYCYTDYHKSNARSVKKDGHMQLQSQATDIEITTQEDEPTKWDCMTEPDMSFMLNDCSKTIEERLQFIQEYKEHPTAEIQMEMIKHNPNSIMHMSEIFPETQIFILEKYSDYVSYIPNPIPEIQYEQITLNPKLILDMENPTDEVIQIALSRDGKLLKYFPNATLEQREKALENNGMAIRYLSEAQQIPELQLIAINNTTKALQYIKNPTHETMCVAIEKEPEIIFTMQNPSFEIQQIAIAQNPALVLKTKNTWDKTISIEEFNQQIHDLWKTAIEHNGSFIRNCARTFPDLRIPAIRQNPFVIQVLRDATNEEISLATSLNPNVILFLKNPQQIAYAKECITNTLGANHVPQKEMISYERPLEMEMDTPEM